MGASRVKWEEEKINGYCLKLPINVKLIMAGKNYCCLTAELGIKWWGGRFKKRGQNNNNVLTEKGGGDAAMEEGVMHEDFFTKVGTFVT